jgi:Protein of unknown function (DUF3313)
MFKPFTPVNRFARTAGQLAIVFAAVGCASVGAPRGSSTLPAFEQLAVGADGVRTWRSPDTRQYEEACVRPEWIRFAGNAALDEAEMAHLRSEIGNALKAHFAQAGLPNCEAPSRSASLTLSATVTAVERAKPGLNAVTSLLLLAPLSRGGITVEFEALDARSGQRVAALAFQGRAGVTDIGSAFSVLGHASKQAEIAAARFVEVVAGSRTAVPTHRP